MDTQTTLANRPLCARDYWTVAVSSMEQVIGTALSCVVGIMIPLIELLGRPDLSPAMQGVTGAAGLMGIAIGSAVIGRLMDRQGYLLWFRLCPLLILAASLVVFFIHTLPVLIVCLFIIGVGVGGGYSLDSAYISEVLPARWRNFFVGVAKASCALGFILPCIVAWLMIAHYDRADIWPRLSLILAGLGLLTLLMRLDWHGSPRWLIDHGRKAEAQAAARFFTGRDVEVVPAADSDVKNVPWSAMWKGRNLLKVIYSGVPWACEGLAVYGFGVFLPVLVMALGIEASGAEGIAKVLNSVRMTLYVNIAILPGFILGLVYVSRMNNARMMIWGFVGSAAGLLVLLAGYLLHWPAWVMVVGFLIFEVALNAGPHLVTYIIPSHIFPVNERGAGSGIAAMAGKVGAIVGVFLMPIWLKGVGADGVLIISIGVMLAGAVITLVFGRLLGLLSGNANAEDNVK